MKDDIAMDEEDRKSVRTTAASVDLALALLQRLETRSEVQTGLIDTMRLSVHTLISEVESLKREVSGGQVLIKQAVLDQRVTELEHKGAARWQVWLALAGAGLSVLVNIITTAAQQGAVKP